MTEKKIKQDPEVNLLGLGIVIGLYAYLFLWYNSGNIKKVSNISYLNYLMILHCYTSNSIKEIAKFINYSLNNVEFLSFHNIYKKKYSLW